MGHARAIELIYDWVPSAGRARQVTEEQVFALHRAVQTAIVRDILKPNGAYKREPNGTYAVTADGRQTFIEYAMPADTPSLMTVWLGELNQVSVTTLDEEAALKAYAHLHLGLVHIHPFWDGNGRMARLLSNLPVLRAGHLPVVIPVSERKRYIDILSAYQLAVGRLTPDTGVWPRLELEEAFSQFCGDVYEATRSLVKAARDQQAARPKSG